MIATAETSDAGDVKTMQRTVHALRDWIERQDFDPEMTLAILTAALSGFAIAHGYKLLTVAEQLVLAGCDHHDQATNGITLGERPVQR